MLLRSYRLAILSAMGLVAAPGCSSGDAVGGTKDFPCTNSAPATGQSGGIETCAEGQVHRPKAGKCTANVPRSDYMCDAGVGGSAPQDCTTDADCSDKKLGQCGIYGQAPECTCRYGCESDADCGADQLCACGDPVGICVRATCKTDADCGGGKLCMRSVGECGSISWHCQTGSDECATNDDCTSPATCAYTDSKWTCLQDNCAAGRPFLVHGAERLPPVANRADWLVTQQPDLSMSKDVRRELARRWTEAGQMEHASVAAFARFMLQLLSLGAPPDLVEATERAISDERRHAQLCFGLASAYGDRNVGPGPLDIAGSMQDLEPNELIALVFREGCVGETVAAVEASHGAEHAMDPVVREALRRIAVDEQRHSELAWRFIAWQVGQQPELARVLEREVHALTEAATRAESVDDEWLVHGLASPATRQKLRRDVLSDVVAPCVGALLSGSISRSHDRPSAYASA